MRLSCPVSQQAAANAACLALFGPGADQTFTVPWVNPGGQVMKYGCGWALLSEAQYDALKAACPSISRHNGTPEGILEGLNLENDPWPLGEA